MNKNKLKHFFEVLNMIINVSLLTAVTTVAIAGLVLNYGFVGGLIIILIVLGIVLAVMRVIGYLIREATGIN